MLEEIEQCEWDELVSSPRSKAYLKRLIAEAKEDEIEDERAERAVKSHHYSRPQHH